MHGHNAEDLINRVVEGGIAPIDALVSANSLAAEAMIRNFSPVSTVSLICLTVHENGITGISRGILHSRRSTHFSREICRANFAV
jgi:hypothetical protein